MQSRYQLEMTRAGRYAELSSAVRCFKSALLDRQRIERLAEAGTLSETVSLLNGGHASSADTSKLASLEAHLIGRVYPLTKRLFSYAPIDARPLLRLLFAKYEFECAKEVLKSIVYQVDPQDAMKRIIPVGRFSAERCKELIEARDANRVVDTLQDGSLKRFISPYLTSEKDGLVVVSALDQYYYSRLWTTASSLHDFIDVRIARSLIGPLIDYLNILVALRSQMIGLDARSVSEMLVPVNYRLGTAFKELAETGSLANIVRVLEGTPYAEALKAINLGTDYENLAEVELALKRNHLAICQNVFAGYPFHVGLALAFLMIKDYELHDLFTILNAKADNVPSDRIRGFLIMGNS